MKVTGSFISYEKPKEWNYSREVRIYRKIEEFSRKVLCKFPQGFLIKNEDVKARERRGIRTFTPYGDEEVYKINKLFQFTVIPKSKVVCLNSMDQPSFSIKPFYINILSETLSTSSTSGLYATTYTIQSYKSGRSPNEEDPISLSSFQQAYLLNLLLGRGDADRRNAIYNPECQKLYEVDNEVLGFKNYDGFLSEYPSLMEQPLQEEVLNNFISVEKKAFEQLLEKYTTKNIETVKNYFAIYSDPETAYEKLGMTLENKENEIFADSLKIQLNFDALIKAIQSLIKQKEPVTINSIRNQFQIKKLS